MPNRLAQSTSPYLKQHEHNPIDWYEWGAEAFEKAKREDKPIFLSIGYSSCHWCHVMAHESFEDAEVAEFLNTHFVSIKVDREERPDVDEAYMTAVQLISGRGGWPTTIFMTPDKKPFFAGTYFPKNDRGQYPGFMTLARNIVGLWRKSRGEVTKSAQEISIAIERTLSRTISSLTSTIQPELFQECFNAQRADFDGTHGGFGSAPKFPSHTGLAFLMDYAMVSPDAAPEALSMVFMTLEKMALGGIHDQLGGGFHRYSTDAQWLLPHFEKMLYDNALLLGNYARAARIAHELEAPFASLFDQTTIGILEWLKREMVSPEGFFYSAIDADSEGEEGLFYLWSVQEVQEVLGDRAPAFLSAFGFEPEGNYNDEATRQKTGLNIPHLKSDQRDSFRSEIQALMARREQRERPMLDHKAIAAWNGLLVRGLLEAEEILLAERCVRAWMQATQQHGELPHQVTLGQSSGHGYLDDYAAMALAALELAMATQKPEYEAFGRQLVTTMRERFFDAEKGGFFLTSTQHEELLGRSKPATDQPIPSGNALAIEACCAVGDLETAERSLMAVLGWAQKLPNATEALIRAAMLFLMTQAADAQSTSEGTTDAVAPVAAVIPPAQPPAPVGKVSAKLSGREIVAQGGEAHGTVILDIPEGLHLNTNDPPARWLVATALEFEGIRPEIDYPKGQSDRYEGVVEIPFRMTGVREPMEFGVRVRFQACTETECKNPDEIVLDGVILPG